MNKHGLFVGQSGTLYQNARPVSSFWLGAYEHQFVTFEFDNNVQSYFGAFPGSKNDIGEEPILPLFGQYSPDAADNGGYLSDWFSPDNRVADKWKINFDPGVSAVDSYLAMRSWTYLVLDQNTGFRIDNKYVGAGAANNSNTYNDLMMMMGGAEFVNALDHTNNLRPFDIFRGEVYNDKIWAPGAFDRNEEARFERLLDDRGAHISENGFQNYSANLFTKEYSQNLVEREGRPDKASINKTLRGLDKLGYSPSEQYALAAFRAAHKTGNLDLIASTTLALERLASKKTRIYQSPIQSPPSGPSAFLAKLKSQWPMGQRNGLMRLLLVMRCWRFLRLMRMERVSWCHAKWCGCSMS